MDHFGATFFHFVFNSKLSISDELWRGFDSKSSILAAICGRKSPREFPWTTFLGPNRADTSLGTSFRYFWGFWGKKFSGGNFLAEAIFFRGQRADYGSQGDLGLAGPGLQPPWAAGLQPVPPGRAGGLSP